MQYIFDNNGDKIIVSYNNPGMYGGMFPSAFTRLVYNSKDYSTIRSFDQKYSTKAVTRVNNRVEKASKKSMSGL